MWSAVSVEARDDANDAVRTGDAGRGDSGRRARASISGEGMAVWVWSLLLGEGAAAGRGVESEIVVDVLKELVLARAVVGGIGEDTMESVCGAPPGEEGNVATDAVASVAFTDPEDGMFGPTTLSLPEAGVDISAVLTLDACSGGGETTALAVDAALRIAVLITPMGDGDR